METRLHRSDWNAEELGCLGQRIAQVVVEDDDGTLLRFEPAEAALDLVAIGQQVRRVDHRGVIDGEKLDLEWSTVAAASLVEAGSHDEASQPGVEPIGVAKGRKIPPGAYEGVLHSVFRPFGIPEDQPSDGVQSSDRGTCQGREGVMIAPLRPLHEIALHVPLGIRLAWPPWPRFEAYGTVRGRTVPNSGRAGAPQPAGSTSSRRIRLLILPFDS